MILVELQQLDYKIHSTIKHNKQNSSKASIKTLITLKFLKNPLKNLDIYALANKRQLYLFI
jgi:hypothetical protein